MLKTWASFYTESLHKSFQKGLIWQTFDPKLQTILHGYISAISVTFRNSGYLGVGRGTDHLTYGAIRKVYIYACLCHATQYHQAY